MDQTISYNCYNRKENGNWAFLVKALLVALFFCPMFLAAQVEEVDERTYYIGEGEGRTYEEARNNAYQQMVGKISLTIESSFVNIEKEENENGTMNSNSSVENVVKTYSYISNLEGVEDVQITATDAKMCRVRCYVKKIEVQKMFNARQKRVMTYTKLARNAEKKIEIDNALRYYYWAFCLLKTIPRNNLLYTDQGDPLITWIPSQIDAVLRGIEVVEEDRRNNTIYLKFYYNGEKLARLDYAVNNRKYTMNSGDGIIDNASAISSTGLFVKCEYEYEEQASVMDPELGPIVKMMKSKPFPQAMIPVKPKPEPDDVVLLEEESSASFDDNASMEQEVSLDMLVEEEDIEPYSKVLKALIAAINSRSFDAANKYFTQQGLEKYRKLIKYGNARIIDFNPDFSYILHNDEVICRSLRMSFSFKNNTRRFVEDVTFTFNKDGKIDCLAFGLGEKAAEDILFHKAYSEEARLVLTEFLENYKTAYALKDLDFIRSVFDDHAIIITGTVLKKAPSKRDPEMNTPMTLNNNKVIYRNYTKESYLAHLEKCFNSNEFVNIRFADNEIHKGNKEEGEVYTINIKQDYYSSHYGDTGYLMLMVDFNNPGEPLIKVRTWSPEPDFVPGMF